MTDNLHHNSEETTLIDIKMDNLLYNIQDDCIFEGMTSITAIINSIKSSLKGTFYDYDRKIKKIFFDESKLSSKRHEYNYLKRNAYELKYELILCEAGVTNQISNGSTHGGIVAVCTNRTINQLTIDNIIDNGYYALLEGIEDPYNFGYSIRSLYASGLDGIILTPRNWMNAAGLVARSSAGTSEMIKMYYSDDEKIAQLFHSKNYQIVAASIRDSVSLDNANLKKPILLVVGGEKRGLSRSLLNLSDCRVRIDYANSFRGSLPTVSAVSIIAFEIMKQNS